MISSKMKTETKNVTTRSPTSVALPIPNNDTAEIQEHDNKKKEKFSTLADNNFELTPSSYHLNLESFVKLLPDTIRNSQCHANQLDPIATLFRRLLISKQEIEPFCLIDDHKNYTRNLIATDNETFTLLLLCWNPGKYSPIHDHPCKGCWMRVCQGCLNEVRYVPGKETGENNTNNRGEKACQQFVCTMDSNFEEGQLTFIDDHIGYHKIGNPGSDMAISMHLYSPPFKKCKIWMNPHDSSKSSISVMCNFSEYGNRTYL